MHIRFTSLILLGLFLWTAGCEFKPGSDPLAGWREAYNYHPAAEVVKDYQSYIHTLSPEEQAVEGIGHLVFFYEGSMGQHAVKIEIGINGDEWEHILIYDKNDKRIKTIKYLSGHYAS